MTGVSKPYQILLLGAALALAAAVILETAGQHARAAVASSVPLLTTTLAVTAYPEGCWSAHLPVKGAVKVDALAQTGRTSAAIRETQKAPGSDARSAYRYVRRAAKAS